MQRQSLGGCSSPGSKLHSYGGKEEKLDEEEQKRKDGSGGVGGVVDDEEEKKVEKLHYRSTFQTEKSIHLIPVLTIFCLLVLYLCSYDPPQEDLLHFDGLRSFPNEIDSIEKNDFGRFLELEKGDVLAIRSHRSLQEVGKDARKSRFHRKIGDF